MVDRGETPLLGPFDGWRDTPGLTTPELADADAQPGEINYVRADEYVEVTVVDLALGMGAPPAATRGMPPPLLAALQASPYMVDLDAIRTPDPVQRPVVRVKIEGYVELDDPAGGPMLDRLRAGARVRVLLVLAEGR